MHSTPAPAAAIRLRADALTAWAEHKRLATEGEMAERIGIDRATLNRVRRGVIAPGEQFIAAVLTATGGKFEKYFELAEAS